MEAVTTTESEWDDVDRGVVYALLDYKADLCPGCGMPMSDYLHVDGQPDKPVSTSYTVCSACVVRERGQMIQDKRDEMIEKSGGTIYRSARRWLMINPDPH